MVNSCMCARVRARVPAGIAIVVTPFGSAFQVAAALVVYSADGRTRELIPQKSPEQRTRNEINRQGWPETDLQ